MLVPGQLFPGGGLREHSPMANLSPACPIGEVATGRMWQRMLAAVWAGASATFCKGTPPDTTLCRRRHQAAAVRDPKTKPQREHYSGGWAHNGGRLSGLGAGSHGGPPGTLSGRILCSRTVRLGGMVSSPICSPEPSGGTSAGLPGVKTGAG
jgi:hypothetical protein